MTNARPKRRAFLLSGPPLCNPNFRTFFRLTEQEGDHHADQNAGGSRRLCNFASHRGCTDADDFVAANYVAADYDSNDYESYDE